MRSRPILIVFLSLIFSSAFILPSTFAADLIFSENYENGLNNWVPFSASARISSERVHSGQYALRSDRSMGTPQCYRNFSFPHDTRKLFLRFWLYVTPNGPDFSGKWARFVTQSSGNEAQMEFWGSNQSSQVFWYTRHNYGQSCGIQGGPVGGGSGTISKGQWNKYELFIEFNDPTASNGRVRQWINRPDNIPLANADSYKRIDVSGVQLSGSGSCGTVYERLHLPTGYNTGSPVIYIDDVELWDDMPDSDSDQGSTPPPADNPPVANITVPSSSSSFTSDRPSIDLGGTASDDHGLTSVTWENSLGGQGNASNDSGDWTSWSVDSLNLQEGQNVITVTARDSDNQTTTDTISVNYISSNNTISWSAVDQTGDTTWTDSTATWCVRALVESGSVIASGDTVMIGFQGRTSSNYTLRKVSIAAKDPSGYDGDVIDSTWTRVTFDGNAEATWSDDSILVQAGSEKLSDPIPFQMQAGNDYYVTFILEAPASYLVAPAYYTQLYFNGGADHTDDIDWSSNGHRSYDGRLHALSSIYVSGDGGAPPVQIPGIPPVARIIP